jgi:hypothetical protein
MKLLVGAQTAAMPRCRGLMYYLWSSLSKEDERIKVEYDRLSSRDYLSVFPANVQKVKQIRKQNNINNSMGGTENVSSNRMGQSYR